MIRFLTRIVISNIEIQLTHLLVICRIAFIWSLDCLSFKIYVICCCALSCILIDWKRNTTLAVFTIMFKFLQGWLEIILTFPSEFCSMILTKQRQTFFNMHLFIRIWSKPTIMSNWTFKSFLTGFKLHKSRFQLWACIGPRPFCCLSTV